MAKSENTLFKEITGTVDEIIREVRKLIREGNARSLIIKNDKGKVLFQTQLTVGVAGTTVFMLMAPIILAITMFVMFANDVKVIVEKDAPSEENDDEHDEYGLEGEVIEITDDDDEPSDK